MSNLTITNRIVRNKLPFDWNIIHFTNLKNIKCELSTLNYIICSRSFDDSLFNTLESIEIWTVSPTLVELKLEVEQKDDKKREQKQQSLLSNLKMNRLFLNQFKNLRELTIRDYNWKVNSDNAFINLPNLKKLKIVSCIIESLSLNYLTSLSELIIKNTEIVLKSIDVPLNKNNITNNNALDITLIKITYKNIKNKCLNDQLFDGSATCHMNPIIRYNIGEILNQKSLSLLKQKKRVINVYYDYPNLSVTPEDIRNHYMTMYFIPLSKKLRYNNPDKYFMGSELKKILLRSMIIPKFKMLKNDNAYNNEIKNEENKLK